MWKKISCQQDFHLFSNITFKLQRNHVLRGGYFYVKGLRFYAILFVGWWLSLLVELWSIKANWHNLTCVIFLKSISMKIQFFAFFGSRNSVLPVMLHPSQLAFRNYTFILCCKSCQLYQLILEVFYLEYLADCTYTILMSILSKNFNWNSTKGAAPSHGYFKSAQLVNCFSCLTKSIVATLL